MSAIDRQALLSELPPPWPYPLLPEIQQAVRDGGRKVVVLDDDPTGTQTVHGVPVLTEWSAPALAAELRNDLPCFYILTNSRSLPLPEAQAMNREIAVNLRAAGRQVGREFVVVSRSDSTLRGHYPGETDALAEGLGCRFDATLIVPFFLEGGRYTIGDVHYVAEGDRLIPAAETPFAADAVFGYRSSNLREWVEEKSQGRVRASEVASITLEDLRRGGPSKVRERLLALRDGQVCVVNAAAYEDLEVLVAGLLAAEAEGRRFLYRTAASFVRVRAGIAPRRLLSREELVCAGSQGGLVVVGSYVPKTTAQLSSLLDHTEITGIELHVQTLLDRRRRRQHLEDVIGRVNRLLRLGSDVVVYTSRALVKAGDAQENLAIGRQVSESLIDIVRRLEVMPRFLIAKGGITSSDVATAGLGIRRAMVLGQILPGVPVWRCGPESRYPGLSYVVFPGNVGDDKALVRIVEMMGEPAS